MSAPVEKTNSAGDRGYYLYKTMTAPVDVTGLQLETDRLILRPMEETDFPELHAILTSPEIARFSGWKTVSSMTETRDRLTHAITSKEELAVVLKQTGRMVGTFSLQARPWGIYPIEAQLRGREFGFELLQDYWGRGLMPEALRAMTDYCLNTMRYDFVTCGYFLGNDRSRRVIEKCGYTFLFQDERTLPSGSQQGIRTYIRYRLPESEGENHV